MHVSLGNNQYLPVFVVVKRVSTGELQLWMNIGLQQHTLVSIEGALDSWTGISSSTLRQTFIEMLLLTMLVESKAPSNLHGHADNSSQDDLSLISSQLKRQLDTSTEIDMCHRSMACIVLIKVNIGSMQSAKKIFSH